MKKKKIAVTLLSAVFTVAGVAGLTACSGNGGGGGGTVDKASQNPDFVAYRKKVVTVLKDNDMFVNDFDNPSAEASAQHPTAQAAAYPEHSSAIRDIIINANPEEDVEAVKSDRNSIFEQTLSISLVIGDALSNYYDEKNFYDIPVYFEEYDQYFEVVKNGDNDLVRCYTPATEYQSASVLTMELVYKSGDDYSFTCMQIWDDQQIYCYGNSQKEYILLCRDQSGKNNNNFIRYMPDESAGYYCTSETAVNECYDLVKDAVEAVDPAPIETLKTRVRYSFNQGQSRTVTEKYFKRPDNVARPEGIQLTEMQGRQVATSYYADGETRAEIPDGTQYIYEDFYIDDEQGTITELVIPASVKAVIDGNGNETSPADFFRLNLRTQQGEKVLQSVTVKSGSTLFKAGAGNLYTAAGQLVYLANSPMDELDFSVFENGEVLRYFEDGLYTRIFDNISEITLDVTELNDLPVEPQRIFDKLNLTKITVSDSQGCGNLNFKLKLKSDLSIDVSLTQATSHFGLSLENVSGGKRNVTVNVTDFADGTSISVVPKQPDKIMDEVLDGGVVPDDSIFTTVNMNMPRDKFTFFRKRDLELDAQNSTINYLQQSENGDQLDALDARMIDDENKTVFLGLADNFTASEITVPTTVYDYTVINFMLDFALVADKSVRVTVPQGVEVSAITPVEGLQINNENFVLVYSGTYKELIGMFGNLMNSADYDITFTAECNGGEPQLMQLGYRYNTENPENYPYEARISFDGDSKIFKLPSSFENYVSLDVTKEFTLDDNRVYFLVNDDNETVAGEYYDGKVYFMVKANQNHEFMLISHECGRKDFTLSDIAENYELNVSVYFERGDAGTPTRAIVTGGTVMGKPVYIQPSEKDPNEGDDGTIDYLQGQHCELFNEFDLILGTDENSLANIRVKLVPDRDGLKLVYLEEVTTYEVTVTLCDGSQLHQSLLWGEKIAFDSETWKTESGYAYYYEFSNGDGSWRNYLDTESKYLDISADNYNITLHKVLTNQEKSFELTGDGYTVSGKVSVYYSEQDKQYFIQITGDSATIGGKTVSDLSNVACIYDTTSQIARVDATDFNYDPSDEETMHITETLMLNLIWDVDNDGNIQVTSAELKSNTDIRYSPFSISSDSVSWMLNINGNFAELMYSVGGDIVAVKECNLSELEFSDGDRDKAVIAEQTVSDGNGGWQTERYLIYIDVETADDGETVINRVGYKKEIVPAA